MLKATRSYIEAITAGFSHKEKITIKEGKNWQADVKNKTLTYKTADLLDLPIESVKGLLLHEIAHLTDTTPISKGKCNMSTYNAYEDIRIENGLINKYGDFSKQALTAIATKGTELWQDKIITGKPGKLQQFLIGTLADNMYYSESYTKFDNSSRLSRASYKINESLDPEVKNAIIDTRTFVDEIKNAKNTQELQKIIDDKIYPYIKDWITKDNNTEDIGIINKENAKIKGKGDCDTNGRYNSIIPSDIEIDSALSPYITTLTKRLKDTLKEQACTRYNGNYKQGRLLSKNAYKIFTNDNRIFSKRNKPNKPVYSIYMLLDSSGSMKGVNHTNTYIASYLLKRACEKLNFKITFIQYSDKARIIDKLENYRINDNGSNHDSFALELAYKTMSKEDNNILFHLTDGGLCQDITEILFKLKKSGCLTIGIGIKTEEVKKRFPLSVVVDDVNKLPQALINLLQRIIHR